MQTRIHLLICLTLVLPAAAAGNVDVDASYLEQDDEQCWEFSDHDGEHHWNDTNGTYYYRGYSYGYAESGCKSGATTASVRAADDEGTLAEATVDGREWQHESSSYSNSYESQGDGDTYESQYHYSDAYHYAEGWQRSAHVGVLGTSADADRGCEYEYAYSSHGYGHSQGSWWGNESYWSSSGSGGSTEESSHRCYETAAATHDGRETSAGRTSGCEGTESAGGHGWAYRGDGYEYHEERYASEGSSTCRFGAQASALGNDAFAGLGSQCSSQGHQDTWGNWTHRWGEESYAYDCFSGVLVEGPQDMTLRAGYYDHSTSSCTYEGENETCYNAYDPSVGADLMWAGNPVGPSDSGFRVGVPLWAIPAIP